MSKPIRINFTHRQSAHCESGVTANLLNHLGINISEAMAFGIGAGLFFAYLPFIRINHLPLVTYRAAAGHLLKRFSKLPGFKLTQRTFSSSSHAMTELDELLKQNIPVGLQTGVFWLPYFPKALRFHFNAHNLVVYGKEGDNYLISDPVFPETVVCGSEDLARARFASGALAPKGKMYHFTRVDRNFDRRSAMVDGIDSICSMMIKSAFPLIGVKGIRFLEKKLRRWPDKLGAERADLHLGHVVRMQEEIGTGGGGFRFMFAAFLQESGTLLGDETLLTCSSSMNAVGDRWREFAAMAARICKQRPKQGDSYDAAADTILQCAAMEEDTFLMLRKWAREN